MFSSHVSTHIFFSKTQLKFLVEEYGSTNTGSDYTVLIFYVNDDGIEICNVTSNIGILNNGCSNELPTAFSISRDNIVSAQTKNNID